MNRLHLAASKVVRLCTTFVLSAIAVSASAQTTTVTGQNLKMGGTPIASGTVSVTPTNGIGTDIPFVGGDGSVNAALPFTATITNGTVASGFTVPDQALSLALTANTPLFYRVNVLNTATKQSYSFLLPPGTLTGSTWALDGYKPTQTAAALSGFATGTVLPNGGNCTGNAHFVLYSGQAITSVYDCVNGKLLAEPVGSGSGVAPTLQIGTVTQGAAAASINGSNGAYTLNLSLPQGTAGANGTTPSFSVGTVATGAAGSQAAVSLSGNATSPVLNFVIPQGASGGASAGVTGVLYGNGSSSSTVASSGQIVSAMNASPTATLNTQLLPSLLPAPSTFGNTGAGAFSASANAQSSQDPALTISYAFTDANIISGNSGQAYAHGVALNNTFSRSAGNCTGLGACAYAGFDDRTVLQGSNNYDHFAGFQAGNLVAIGSGNTLNRQIGVVSVPRLASGSINYVEGIEIDDLTQTGGSVVNQYGMHILPQTKAGGSYTSLASGASVAANFGLVVDQSSGGNLLGGNTTISANYATEGALIVNNPNTGSSAWSGVEVWSVDRNHSFKFGAFGSNWQTGISVLYPNSAYFGSAAGMTAGIVINTEVNAPISFGVNSVVKAKITANGLNLTQLTPASSSAACNAGDFAADGSYLYACTAQNTWRRAALSTF